MNADLLVGSALSALIFLICLCLYGKLLDCLRGLVAKKCGGFFATLTFIGIAHHELSHAVVALLTGAKVNSIVLFRLKAKNGNLGEVKITPRGLGIFKSLQICLSSAAPMILGSLNLFLMLKYLNPILDSWKLALAIYVEITILLNMSLSKQDILNILKHMFWLLILTVGLFYAFKINFLVGVLHSIAGA